MSKVLKFVWFLSLFGGLGALLWSYASVPLEVKIMEEISLNREAFFYIALFFLCVANFSLYAISKNNFGGFNERLQIWKYTFGVIINAFYIVSVMFIALFNNTQNFDFDNFGYLILTFLVLLVLWTLALPVLVLITRKNN